MLGYAVFMHGYSLDGFEDYLFFIRFWDLKGSIAVKV